MLVARISASHELSKVRSCWSPFFRNRATGTENDGTTHAAKFEERQLDALVNAITDLGAPASIAVRCQAVVVFGVGR